MKKNVFLIFLVCFACITFLLVSPGCKSPNSPELPDKYGAFVEFMYKRTKTVVDNNATGPIAFMIWNKEQGGKTIKPLTYLGNDQWTTTTEGVFLFYNSKAPYWIYTLDMKVTGVYETVAETFYARIQGTSEWKELTCIGVIPDKIGGLATKFYLYDGAIVNPS